MMYLLARSVLLLFLSLSPWISLSASSQPTSQQFKLWLFNYNHNDLGADFNYDGVLTPADFSAFLANYDSPPGTNGWTDLNPSSASIVYYVSSSQGNDSNDGRSSSRPLKTIQRAYDLLRDGQPDWIRLRSGDTFFESLPNWKKSGLSKTQPMVLSSYGTSTQKPRIWTGSSPGMRATGPNMRKHLRFVGFYMLPNTRTISDSPSGFAFICPHKDILVEDCIIRGYSDNLLFQGLEGDRASDIRIRRSVINDSWAVGQHSQGLYATRVDGLLIEESVFDHNGWNSNIPGAEPTIFNHNIYVQTSCTNLNVKGNIVSNAASHGLQARPGGNITGNLFYRNSISILLGNEETETTGIIENNVILEGKDISPTLRRGMGIHIQYSQGARIKDNLILRNGTDAGQSEAIAIIGDSNKLVRDLVIEDNTIYNWLNNINIENAGTRTLTFRNNIIYDSQSESPAIRHFQSSTLDDVTAYSNTYFIGGTSRWFRSSNSYYSLSQWLNVSQETNPISINGRSFYDDSRDMTRYAQHQLLPPNAELVINRARVQGRTNWDEDYTAAKMVDFFKAGYVLQN